MVVRQLLIVPFMLHNGSREDYVVNKSFMEAEECKMKLKICTPGLMWMLWWNAREMCEKYDPTPDPDVGQEHDCNDAIASSKENKGSFFLLRNLAVEILSIPASSSSSECAFSVGTRVNSI